MTISRSDISKQVARRGCLATSARPPRNKVAKALRTPKFKQRVVESKKRYTRKKNRGILDHRNT